MKSILTAGLVMATLSAAPVQAAESLKLQSGEVKTGETYGEVRERLIENGWLPAGTCEGDAFMCNPAYPELESCAGTGTAPCRFGWKAGEGSGAAAGPSQIAVITEGEQGRIVTGFITDPEP